MKTALHTTAALAFALLSVGAAATSQVDGWPIGFWGMIEDEDGSPADTMEFRADGTYINYGSRCRVSRARYHVFGGDIYVTAEIAGKGPIALVFRPTAERTRLVYTSPRTAKNAIYERVQIRPCQKS